MNIRSSYNLSKAPCLYDSPTRKVDRPQGLRHRNQSRKCPKKPRIERGMAKPTKHLPSSKSKAVTLSSRPTQLQSIDTDPHPHLLNPSSPFIKGILLTKHSSYINLSSLPIPPIPDSRNSDRPTTTTPVRKKVRFSSRVGLGSVDEIGWNLGRSNQLEEDHHSAHLEPVIETIFFTHSRYAYDRSPITVDKVLNKSLALPPRSDKDDDTPRGLTWLTELDLLNHHLPPSPDDKLGSIVVESSRKRYLTTRTVDILLPLDLNPQSPSLVSSPVLQTTRSQPCYAPDPDQSSNSQFPTRSRHLESALNKRLNEPADGSDGGRPSSRNAKPLESTNDRLGPLQPSSIPTTIQNEESHDGIFSQLAAGGERSLTRGVHVESSCDLLADGLELEDETGYHDRRIENCCAILEAAGGKLAGFGNWTRAQVFDSCDALDGF